MRTPKAVTQADRHLQAGLAARGLWATPDQFKRWRAHGLLDGPARPGRGRGRGRPSDRYPEHAVEQAATIIELLSAGVRLDEMAVVMLLQGVPRGDAAVRASLQVMLSDPRLDSLDEEAVADSLDSFVGLLLRNAGRIPLVSHWREQARGADEPATRRLSDVVTAVAHAALSGTWPSYEAMEITADVLGLAPGETEPFFERVTNLLPALREAASDVTIEELLNANLFLSRITTDFPDGGQPDYGLISLTVLGIAVACRTEEYRTLFESVIELE